ncbi:hypothetical protein TcWFU_001475 [Taenia crassiceps]|uniref:Uncharacterized protein n=1 Tax=Taenia crassiceps TaxID=6207 RepID=A0ABR4QD16_9CEST
MRKLPNLRVRPSYYSVSCEAASQRTNWLREGGGGRAGELELRGGLTSEPLQHPSSHSLRSNLRHRR